MWPMKSYPSGDEEKQCGNEGTEEAIGHKVSKVGAGGTAVISAVGH